MLVKSHGSQIAFKTANRYIHRAGYMYIYIYVYICTVVGHTGGFTQKHAGSKSGGTQRWQKVSIWIAGSKGQGEKRPNVRDPFAASP